MDMEPASLPVTRPLKRYRYVTKEEKKEAKRRKQEARKISEETRNQFQQTLDEFKISNREECPFKTSVALTNFERAEVHKLCKKMGMYSISFGKGAKRHLILYKSKHIYKTKFKTVAETKYTYTTSKNTKPKLPITSFSFSEEGKMVLKDFFSRYPPGDLKEAENIAVPSVKKIDDLPMRSDDIFCKPVMKKAEIAAKLESVVAKMRSDPALKKITEDRLKLPIASFKDVITSTIQSNQLVLICGETGCGKTTQVPQYLLDYMWSKGEACKIVCTQPRRISAITVSERIAVERGEPIGESVGYKIRLEKQGGSHSSIVFCTVGVLLRVLVNSGKHKSSKMAKNTLSDITHIIVDEIHERDRFSDFALTVMRDVLPLYPRLRVVLMSATLDAERFSEYFGGCPILRVPGFTYDVKKFYLEDVLMLVKSKSTDARRLDGTSKTNINEKPKLTEDYKRALDEAINVAWSSDDLDSLIDIVAMGEGLGVCDYQHSVTGVTPLMVFARKGKISDVCMLLSLGANCHLRDNEGKTALSWAGHADQKEASEILRKHLEKAGLDPKEESVLLNAYLKDANPELVDIILIEQLLRKICTESRVGAILVFLPGWDEIQRLQSKLNSSNFFKDSSKFLILVLHSMVPPKDQKKVFQRPPVGCRKIVLSTNVAETSVTIDDVVFVIDSGRVKEKTYDPFSQVTALQSSWISKANAKQREGRAGRCQPGICYHLYSKVRAASLLEFQVPEIKRTPIEELCLQVKILDPSSKIEDFLKKTLDPPVSLAIHNAITALQGIGALSANEELTELGEKLGWIPVHPLTSKMLFFAISMNCLDPALTLACASDLRDPFTFPMMPNGRKLVNAAKSELASIYGSHGDHFAIIAAFECWKAAQERGLATQFCYKYFLSANVMKMLSKMRQQLQRELHVSGFIPKHSSRLNENSRNSCIINAVLVAGLYPRVGKLLLAKFTLKGYSIKNASIDEVRLSSQSVNCGLKIKKGGAGPLVIYDEVTRGDGGLNIKNCSIVAPLPLLLLATEFAVAPADLAVYEGEDSFMSNPDAAVTVIADRWLSFKSTALDAAQICCLREKLSAAILFKVAHPGKRLPSVLAASLEAIARVLSCDGLVGINGPDDSFGPSTSAVTKADPGRLGAVVGSVNSSEQHPPPPDEVPENQHDNQGSEVNEAKALLKTM